MSSPAWNFDPTYRDIAHINIYGCTRCPECKEPWRCSFFNDQTMVVCNGCGFKEPVVLKPAEETESP